MKVLDPQDLSKTVSLADCEDMSSFGALSRHFVETLLQSAEIMEFGGDEQIFPAGEKASCFYILLYGGVSLFSGEPGKQRKIADVSLGQSFGFASLIGLRHRSYQARSSGQSIVLRITSTLFASLYERDQKEFPVFFLNLSRDMSRFLAYLAEQAN
ncbi:MAG: cyclic nucleotide-binding domain-containing protein [Gammaproteobacteria bacterium]|nr:cyclic nucleotide-binding domain-containing protein [Gammaproteobacteria bacterium]